MAETSKFWNGISSGDSGFYSLKDLHNFIELIFCQDGSVQGPVHNKLNELAVSYVSGTTIRVATGYAIVRGVFYKNDANIDLSVTVPVSGSNYYFVVLRRDTISQTVRVVLLGPNSTRTPPLALERGEDTDILDEIPLATVEVHSDSSVHIVDDRFFCQYNTDGPT